MEMLPRGVYFSLVVYFMSGNALASAKENVCRLTIRNTTSGALVRKVDAVPFRGTDWGPETLTLNLTEVTFSCIYPVAKTCRENLHLNKTNQYATRLTGNPTLDGANIGCIVVCKNRVTCNASVNLQALPLAPIAPTSPSGVEQTQKPTVSIATDARTGELGFVGSSPRPAHRSSPDIPSKERSDEGASSLNPSMDSLPEKLRGIQTNMSSQAIYLQPTETATSTRSPSTDDNLVLILVLFGLIIVLFSFLAGNAGTILSKCRIFQPPQDEVEAVDTTSSPHTGNGWRTRVMSLSNDLISRPRPLTTKPRGTSARKDITSNMRSQSCYDRDIIVGSTGRRDEPLRPLPPLANQRKLSTSDGCVFKKCPPLRMTSTEVRSEFLLRGDSREYSLPYDAMLGDSPGVVSIVWDWDSTDVSRGRLDSEFTYGRDRFLSNALKSMTIGAGCRSLYDASSRMSGCQHLTLKSFLSTQSETRCLSLLSLSGMEDPFSNEHIYESISLDDVSFDPTSTLQRKSRLGYRQPVCSPLSANITNPHPIIEGNEQVLTVVGNPISDSARPTAVSIDVNLPGKAIPMNVENLDVESNMATGGAPLSRMARHCAELEPLYLTLDEISEIQRRCSLPSPSDLAITRACETSAEPTYLQGRWSQLHQTFRSERNVFSPRSPKFNFFETCTDK